MQNVVMGILVDLMENENVCSFVRSQFYSDSYINIHYCKPSAVQMEN